MGHALVLRLGCGSCTLELYTLADWRLDSGLLAGHACAAAGGAGVAHLPRTGDSTEEAGVPLMPLKGAEAVSR